MTRPNHVRTALIVLLGAALVAPALAAAESLPAVTDAQLDDLSSRCSKEIDAVNAFDPTSKVTLKDRGLLHDIAVNTDPTAISNANLKVLTKELRQAQSADDGEMMASLIAASICLVRGRLDQGGRLGKAERGPATLSAVPAPKSKEPAPDAPYTDACKALQADFDRNEPAIQRYRDQRESGHYLANKLSGDMLAQDLGKLRSQAVKQGCPKAQTDDMKARIKDLHWVIEHTTRF